MKRALVTGSSGFVGQALVAELRRRELAVTCAVRKRLQGQSDAEAIEVGDLADSTDWSQALRGVDTVFHLAARVHHREDRSSTARAAYTRENVAATVALARAAASAGVKRLVFVSSVKVMGDASGDGPLDENIWPQPRDAYGWSKLEAERAIAGLAGRIEISVVRPPLVYGPRVRANFLSLLKLASSGWPLPLGAAHARRSIIFIDNLVDALIACAAVQHGSPATYFVSDGRDLSVADLVTMMRREMGINERLWPLSPNIAQVSARLLGRGDVVERLFSPLQVEIGKIRAELGWVPPVSTEDGIRATVRWFMQAKAEGAV